MYVLLIIIILLALLAIMRIGLFAEYTENGFSGVVRILFFRFAFPKSERKEHAEKKEEKEQKKPSGGDADELVQIIRPIFSALGKLIHSIRIHELTADIKIASGDAFQTAMLYGGTAAIVGALQPLLENNFKIKKKSIRTVADFESSESTAYFSIRFSIAVWQAIVFFARIVYRYIKLKTNKKKGRK